jgi:hypothetical protein
MKSLDLNPALPDISSSLKALRIYVNSGDESSKLDQEAAGSGRELHSPEAEQ